MFVCDDVERNSFGFFSPLSCVYAFGDRCGIYSILSSFLFSQLVVNMWTWMRHECVWEWICVCIKATPLSGFAFFAFSNPIRLSLLFVGMICIVAIQTVMFDISSSSSSSREKREPLYSVRILALLPKYRMCLRSVCVIMWNGTWKKRRKNNAKIPTLLYYISLYKGFMFITVKQKRRKTQTHTHTSAQAHEKNMKICQYSALVCEKKCDSMWIFGAPGSSHRKLYTYNKYIIITFVVCNSM